MGTKAVSRWRADTRRNHERILAAAAKSLDTTGELSFNAIAKKAQVGVGTVYRHFPTSAALILAVYEREVRQLVDVVPCLLETHTPDEAFRLWTTEHLAHYMMTKRGLADALHAAATDEALPASGLASVIGAVDTLLRANIEAGTVRPDVDAETVMRGLSGMFFLDADGDWKGEAARLTDLLWRGMRA